VIAYLEHPKVVACGGSWMVKSALIAAGNSTSYSSRFEYETICNLCLYSHRWRNNYFNLTNG
jgi:hypothetical protein